MTEAKEPPSGSLPEAFPPPGSWDCHVHVFGDPQTFPLSPARAYTPLPAPAQSLARLMSTLGVERVVLVQASVYGHDNSCLLAGLDFLGERARGIVSFDPLSIPNFAQLQALHAKGVRGVRLHARGARPLDPVLLETKLAPALREMNWVLDLFTDERSFDSIGALVRTGRLRIVLDHMASAPLAGARAEPALRRLGALLDTGAVWVKLSAPYRWPSDPRADPNAEERLLGFVARYPGRFLWGSDWPHTPPHDDTPDPHSPPLSYRDVDAGALLSALRQWCGDAEARYALCCKSPTRNSF